MYGVSPQAIVDFPFNTFIDDETFALAVGQELVIPGGVITKAKPWSSPSKEKAETEIASLPAPVFSGDQQFIWPTHGAITQGFSWYHRAIDIADPAAPPLLEECRQHHLLRDHPATDHHGRQPAIPLSHRAPLTGLTGPIGPIGPIGRGGGPSITPHTPPSPLPARPPPRARHRP